MRTTPARERVGREGWGAKSQGERRSRLTRKIDGKEWTQWSLTSKREPEEEEDVAEVEKEVHQPGNSGALLRRERFRPPRLSFCFLLRLLPLRPYFLSSTTSSVLQSSFPAVCVHCLLWCVLLYLEQFFRLSNDHRLSFGLLSLYPAVLVDCMAAPRVDNYWSREEYITRITIRVKQGANILDVCYAILRPAFSMKFYSRHRAEYLLLSLLNINNLSSWINKNLLVGGILGEAVGRASDLRLIVFRKQSNVDLVLLELPSRF
jgi:hypothetical protein